MMKKNTDIKHINLPFYLILIAIFFMVNFVNAADTNILTSPGFESGTTGWTARSATISAVTSPAPYSGTYCGKATGRTATWNGIQQDLLGKMVVGSTYAMSGWVRASSSSTVKMSVQKTVDGTTTYANVATGAANSTGWIQISGSYTLTSSGTLTELLVYFEGPDSGIDIYVDNAVVYGEEAGTSDPNAIGEINVNTRHQTIEGFGAAGAWYEGTLTTLGSSKPEIYDVLFGDLGLDIYRLRNAYNEDNGTSYMSASSQIIANAEASLGRPIKVLVSSWSPPDSLKSGGDTIGGTLAGGPSSYVYSSFATWWANSIVAWAGYGVDVNYISIQNEPDYEATWDSCRLEPSETTSYAGYDQAFEAVYDAVYAIYGSSMPKMLGPEITGFNGASGSTPSAYISAMDDLSHVYGYAHHMYNINAGDTPDSYLTAMQSFNSTWGSKPLFQTEYEKATGSWPDALNMAWLLHNALTIEEVSGYLYWDLFWGSTSVGLVSITSSSYTINSDYYGFKHFSKFIDSGWQRVDTTEDSDALRMSAYISSDNSQLSVIIINTSDSDVNLSLSFTDFTIEDGDIYRTTETQNCVDIGTYNSANALNVPANSITTLALSSSIPDTTPPATPTGLSAIAGNSMVTLNWNDNSESDLAGYNVYRSTTSGSGYSKLNSSLVSSSNYTDSAASNNVKYYYAVTAVDTNDNESDYSNEVPAMCDTTPPAAPTGLSATAGNQKVTLNWNDNSESDLDGYNVYRSTTSGSGFTKLNSSLLSSSDYNDTTVTNKTAYYYVVTAIDANDNESVYSNEVAAIPDYQNCSDVQNGGYGLASDLNSDCFVNLADLEIISQYWLNTACASNSNCEGADFSPTDGTVDFLDFSDFATEWMQCNDPQTTECTTNW